MCSAATLIPEELTKELIMERNLYLSKLDGGCLSAGIDFFFKSPVFKMTNLLLFSSPQLFAFRRLITLVGNIRVCQLNITLQLHFSLV